MTAGRAPLEDCFRTAITELDVSRRTACAVQIPTKGASVLAVGKVAATMLRGLLSRSFSRALVVLPDGVPSEFADPRVEILRANHPVPDARSVNAAGRAMDFVRRGPHVIVLLSGGTSSLLCSPRGCTLDEKAELSRALLTSGATISEFNTVRRHLSGIKGGGLLRHAAPRDVFTYAFSDVIAGGPFDIGSGPTLADPTTVNDARGVLHRYAPQFSKLVLSETVKPGSIAARRSHFHVIASPELLAQQMADRLRRRGLTVRILPSRTSSIASFVTEYVALASSLAPGEALVRAAEPTIAVTNSKGKGGRAGHLAAELALKLGRHIFFLAGASDGVDGTSSAAGAIIEGAMFSPSERRSIREALKSFDSAAIHTRYGTAITMHPTGQNLADVHILARFGR